MASSSHDPPYARRNYVRMESPEPQITTQHARGLAFQVMKWRPSHNAPTPRRSSVYQPAPADAYHHGPPTPQSPYVPSPEGQPSMPLGRDVGAVIPRTDPASHGPAQNSHLPYHPPSEPATPEVSGDTPIMAQVSARPQLPGKKLSIEEEITLIRACCDLENIYGKGASGWVTKFWLEVSRRFKALCGRTYTAPSCQRKMTQLIEQRREQIAQWHDIHGPEAELPTPDEWQVFMDEFLAVVDEYEASVAGRPRVGRKRKRVSGPLGDEDAIREAEDLFEHHDAPVADHSAPASAPAPAPMADTPRPLPRAENQLDEAYREAELMREVLSRLRRPAAPAITPVIETERLDRIEWHLSSQAQQLSRVERTLASRLTNLEMRFMRVETELDKRFSKIEALLLAQGRQNPVVSENESPSSNDNQEPSAETSPLE